HRAVDAKIGPHAVPVECDLRLQFLAGLRLGKQLAKLGTRMESHQSFSACDREQDSFTPLRVAQRKSEERAICQSSYVFAFEAPDGDDKNMIAGFRLKPAKTLGQIVHARRRKHLRQIRDPRSERG